MAIRNVRGPGYGPGRTGTGRAGQAERVERTEAAGDALERERRALEPEWIPPLDPEAELDARRGKQVELQLDGVIRQAEIEARFALEHRARGSGPSPGSPLNPREVRVDPAVGRLMQLLDGTAPPAASAAPKAPAAPAQAEPEQTVVSAESIVDDEVTQPAAGLAAAPAQTAADSDDSVGLLDEPYAAEDAFLLSAGAQRPLDLTGGQRAAAEEHTGWELGRPPAAPPPPGPASPVRWRLGYGL